jgi:hypothetical protein
MQSFSYEQRLQLEIDTHDVACKLSSVFRDELEGVITAIFEEGDPYYLSRSMKRKINHIMDELIAKTKEMDTPPYVESKEEFI